jgi:DNA-binding NtrC family response regulator
MESRLDALLATPDDAARRVLLELLDRLGWSATSVDDPAAMEQRLGLQLFDVVIVDASWCADESGRSSLRLRELSPASSLVLLGAAEAPTRASALTPDGVLATPVEAAPARSLLEAIGRTRAQAAQERRWDALLDAEIFLLGETPAIRAVVQELELVARSGAAVLMTGERGLGQAGLARRLHERSERASLPFVSIDCERLQGELLEAELFGREVADGSERSPGAVERAHRGSLFIDALDHASIPVQRKLLRLLEDGAVQDGSTGRRIKVDVRVLVAASTSLAQKLAAGEVLPELYYRLSSMEIRLPPLRERKADLRSIVDAVLARLQGPKGLRRLTADAWFALSHHDFPDNVREVIRALSRAVILAGDGEIGLQHLPPNLRSEPAQGGTGAAAASPTAGVGRLDPAAKNFERDFLVRALAAAGGNRTRAAELLGMSRKGLWQKLRAHDIPASEGRGRRAVAPDASSSEEAAPSDAEVIRGPWSKTGTPE